MVKQIRECKIRRVTEIEKQKITDNLIQVLSCRLEETQLNLRAYLFASKCINELAYHDPSSPDLMNHHLRVHVVYFKFFAKDPSTFSSVISEEVILEEIYKNVLMATVQIGRSTSDGSFGSILASFYSLIEEIICIMYNSQESHARSIVDYRIILG